MALVVKNIKTSKIDQNDTIQEPPTYEEQLKITWKRAILLFFNFYYCYRNFEICYQKKS